uniref:uncharacterized protein LOC101298761 isoform X2 n=1 Tax=Fragaria vesca subsp. vesca TaxID=101020 RepID=UPI0005CAA990|nr:PREDICTED: uncharacterized protein LOC101298761 isoform X2 [Fragaria vesca subsp. vesca]
MARFPNHIILGLPQHGEAVLFRPPGPNRSYKSDFTWRYFLREKKPRSRKLIHSLLINLLNGNERTDIEDVVRLTLMELFTTFLFAHSEISWDLMKYCEDFENLSRYSWAEAVGEFLNKSLKVQSKSEISGCGLLIPFWLCEKTNIIQPISGREVVEGHVPTLIKWSLPELNTKMKQIAICAIQPFFKEQDGVKAGINGENEIQEHKEGEVDQDELKKVENKERESSKQLREEVQERRKLQHNDEQSDVKNNLDERDGKMEINTADQLNFQSPSVAILPSPRDEIEVFQIGHEMRSPPKGTAVTFRKQQLDPDYVCDVVPNNKKAKIQHALSDPTRAVPSRSIQVPAGKKDEPIVIIEDSSASEEEESPRKRKCSRKESFRLERYEVFKLMDDEHQQKLKAFWNMAGTRGLFWSGKNASVTRQDVEKLIKDTAVASNLIDAFMELLEQQSSVKESTYISTLYWNYVSIQDARKQSKRGKIDQVRDEARDKMGLNQLVFDPLLRSMAKIDYVFFPIISKFHYSLLILNKSEKKWTHYNPLRKRSGLHIDPCYEVAKQMHLMIQKWLHTTQKEAPTMLLEGTKRKMTSRNPESWAIVSLTEDEKRSLTWMVDHNIDFKLENDLKCPQQDFKSLDCGIFIMYYMNQLSQGLRVEEEISRCRMWEFRKHLIECFADHESSWTQSSTT